MYTNKRELPYIEIKNPPLKLLIDTGATKSFLNPQIGFKYYKNKLIHEPFVVTSIFQNHSQEYCVNIPTFSEFNSDSNLKFYLFKFHDVFDGLIGLDNLKLLNANINFPQSKLITEHSTLPIEYYESQKAQIYSTTLKPNTITKVRLPVDKNGTIIIPTQDVQGAKINETLTDANNNFAYAELINDSEHELQISLKEPIKTSCIDLEEFHLYSAEILPQDMQDINIHQLIRTDHMNNEEMTQILKLCQKYADIFHQENTPLTFTNQVKHQIKTKDEIPVYTRSYRYPYVHKTEVHKQISSMLDQGILRPSNSPWSSPIWIVPKKPDASGKVKWRIVVDYRKINEKTIDDRYPIPNITDILDKLGKCQYFTTLDLASGFHQIEMSPEDIQKTAFNVENGHFEYTRMPFGLKNAPATFQRVMDNVLKGLQNDICLVYMDDIIIYSTSLAEHILNLTKVFQRLRESNLKIQLDKSEFLQKQVAFLGHIVTPEGIKPNPEKIKAILKYPIPRTTKEIKGFLGLLGYYRKFIKDFARITKPLTLCLKKDSKIEHTPEFIECFETCKNLLTNEPLLQYPDFSKPFNLTTDASNYALGAILSQGPIGSDKPIAFASRTLNNSETNYSTIEKETLAIVWATKYFRPYLFGRKFKILTDHKPLQWLFSLKEPNSKLVRWRLRLEEFDYEICYKKGKKNTNADALSRIEINTRDMTPLQKYIENFNDKMTVREEENQLDDASLYNNQNSITAELDEDEREDTPNQTQDDETNHSNEEEPVLTIPISEKPVNFYTNQIIFKTMLYGTAKPKITKPFPNKKRLTISIGLDKFESNVVDFFKNYIPPKTKHAMYFDNNDKYQEVCEILRQSFLNSSFDLVKCNTLLEDVTSTDEQKETIKKYHESKTNHRGTLETETRIRLTYYWPKLREDIQDYINQCDTCQINKYDRNPIKPKFMITPTPTKPFEIVHLDLFQVEKQKFLTIIDSFSKYTQAYPLEGGNSINIVKALLIYINHHGLPHLFVADNGLEFKNKMIQEFMETHKTVIHYTTPGNTQSNGMIERVHSTLIEHLRILKYDKKISDVKELMLYAILGYNNSIHSITKQKPIDVINGHLTTRDPFDINLDNALLNNYISQHREKTKELYAKIHKCSLDKKTAAINNQNTKRQDPISYKAKQKVYVKRFSNIRNKMLPKYTPQVVTKNKKVTIGIPGTTRHKRFIKNVPTKQTDTDVSLQVDSHPSTSATPGHTDN